MLGALRKLRDRLTKTREGFVRSLQGVLGERRTIDDALLEDVEATLLAGDVGVRATERIVSALRDAAKRGEAGSSEEAWGVIRREALSMLGGANIGGGWREPETSPARSADSSARTGEVASDRTRPRVLLIVGVNGVGKTTTVGKLARRLTQGGERVLLAAGDTFRAAGSEQLEIWAGRAGAEIVRQEKGADPASVAFDAYARARARAVDTLLIDTAGRLHTKSNLVEELKKVRRVLSKQDPALPDEVLLVLDATTGQNALAQARTFASEIGVTGLVVTKLDGTSKGGVLLALTQDLGIPVRYIGVGEGEEDLEDFDPEAFVTALLGEAS
jgi:fused signal recognition particle receptor